MAESQNALPERWAADNGYELLHCEYRMLSTGPFFGTAISEKRPVYHVQVRDPAGKTRSGWIRFRSRFWGLMPDKTEVKWGG